MSLILEMQPEQGLAYCKQSMHINIILLLLFFIIRIEPGATGVHGARRELDTT